MGSKKKNEADEVEELLRQTQDDILLKLTINSHTTSSRTIDPDLDRRFNALKSKKNTIKTPPVVDPTLKTSAPAPGFNTRSSNDVKSIDVKSIDDDDLFARFSTLKNSKNKSSASTSKDSFVEKQLKLTEFDNVDDNDDDDDEVEKLIKWAIDAARLDPSPPSEDDNEDDDDEDSDDEDEDEDVNANGKKYKKK